MEGQEPTMIRCRRAGRRSRGFAARSGAEVLEAALVFPILLALAFGTVEFGYYFYTEHNLTCAAREGARAGVPTSAASNPTGATDAAVDVVMHQSGIMGGYNIQRFPSADGKYW